MDMTNKLLTSGFLMVFFALGGCVPENVNNTETTSPLSVNGEWKVATLNSQPLTPGLTLRLNLEKGSVSGSAGCNGYFGPVQSLGNAKVKIGHVATNRKYCPEPGVMDLEGRFVRTLEEMDTVSVQGGVVTLSGNGKQITLTK